MIKLQLLTFRLLLIARYLRTTHLPFPFQPQLCYVMILYS